jgi:serine/threonine protein kinase
MLTCSRRPALIMIHLSQLQQGTVIDQRYVIDSLIGVGGLGAVYRCRDIQMERVVVLKFLRLKDPDAIVVSRFLQEAKVLAELSHENIVKFFCYGVWNQTDPYIVQEFLEGKDLRGAIPNLGLQDVIDIGGQLCAALEHAHERGVIHRDLKPENIFLVADASDKRCVKVLDFGLCKLLPNALVNSGKLTQTGLIVGTPAYMSPEQARGELADERSDLYSLGCILYEMIAGQPLFHGKAINEILMKHVDEPAPDLSAKARFGTNSELERLVMRLLAKEPKSRYGSAREVESRLRQIKPSNTKRTATFLRFRKAFNPKAIAGGLALLICLAIYGLGVIPKQQHKSALSMTQLERALGEIEAKEQINSTDVERAVALIDTFLDSNDSVDAREMKARWLLRSSSPDSKMQSENLSRQIIQGTDGQDDLVKIKALRDLEELSLQRGDQQTATHCCEQMLQIWTEHPKDPAYAQVVDSCLWRYSQMWRDSSTIFLSSLLQVRKSGLAKEPYNSTSSVQVAECLALNLQKSTKGREAILAANEAIRIARQLADKSCLNGAICIKCRILMKQGHFPEATTLLLETMQSEDGTGFNLEKMQTRLLLASCLAAQKQYQKSHEILRQAEALVRWETVTDQSIDFPLELGTLYFEIGDEERAAQVISRLEQLDSDKCWESVRCLFGPDATFAQRAPQARLLTERLTASSKKDGVAKARAIGSLVYACLLENDVGSALKWGLQAEKSLAKFNAPLSVQANNYHWLSVCYECLRQPDRALKEENLALATLRKNPQAGPYREAMMLCRLGHLWALKGNNLEAQTQYSASYQLLQQTSQLDTESGSLCAAYSLAGEASCFLAARDLGAARHCLTRACKRFQQYSASARRHAALHNLPWGSVAEFEKLLRRLSKQINA